MAQSKNIAHGIVTLARSGTAITFVRSIQPPSFTREEVDATTLQAGWIERSEPTQVAPSVYWTLIDRFVGLVRPSPDRVPNHHLERAFTVGATNARLVLLTMAIELESTTPPSRTANRTVTRPSTPADRRTGG